MMQCDAGGGAIDEKACGAFVMRWRMEMIGNLASRVMLPRFFLIFLLTCQCTISNSNSGSAPSATLPYQHLYHHLSLSHFIITTLLHSHK